MGLALLPTVTASATVGLMEIAVDTTLTEDHNGPIEIVSDNVTLDCAGHKVTGIGKGYGIVLSGRTGVTVRNCDVSGFVQGITLYESDDNTIEENHAHDNTSDDFSVGIGIYGSSDNNTISKNLATGNGNQGIHVGMSEGNTIFRKSAISNGRTGIILHLADNNIAMENVASNNKSNGVWVGDSAGNTISGSEARNNACDRREEIP